MRLVTVTVWLLECTWARPDPTSTRCLTGRARLICSLVRPTVPGLKNQRSGSGSIFFPLPRGHGYRPASAAALQDLQRASRAYAATFPCSVVNGTGAWVHACMCALVGRYYVHGSWCDPPARTCMSLRPREARNCFRRQKYVCSAVME